VPSIDYHLRYRTDRELYDLVRECRDFISGSGADFLVGNDHGVRGLGGGADRVDYNAALAFPRGGGGPEVYAKSRLVPFGEWFPFERALPRLHAIFEAKADGFWEPGPGPASLALAGTRVAAPICFEDCFGEGVRAMAGEGVGLVLPLVNDEWSRSEAAERQHLACSVLRAIETGKPVARAANSGMTALIDGRGRVVAELPPFARGTLRVAVDCAPGARTVYLAAGDLFARACLGLALGALAAAAIELAGRRRRP
jgi:apolipoprotein N-acyltransferase